jgi:hypothetical protein
MAEARRRTSAESHNGNNRETVFVACRVINGLNIQVSKLVDHMEATPMGPKETKIGRTVGSIRLIGPRTAFKLNPSTDFDYVINEDVPADLWQTWWEENKDTSEIILNRLVLASTSRSELEAMCRDAGMARTGMEPLSPSGDPRAPKNVVQEEEQAKRQHAGAI